MSELWFDTGMQCILMQDALWSVGIDAKISTVKRYLNLYVLSFNLI